MQRDEEEGDEREKGEKQAKRVFSPSSRALRHVTSLPFPRSMFAYRSDSSSSSSGGGSINNSCGNNSGKGRRTVGHLGWKTRDSTEELDVMEGGEADDGEKGGEGGGSKDSDGEKERRRGGRRGEASILVPGHIFLIIIPVVL
jgi:hypothetical protein